MQFTTLKDSKSFKNIFDNGVKVVTPFFVLFFLKSISDAPIQIGLVASKKHFKRAVDRNLCRRRLRASFLKIKDSKGFDCVIVCRKPLLTAQFSELTNQLEKQITRMLLP